MNKTEWQNRFDAVIADNGHRFGKIARTYAGDAAEDLLQEILLQVWRSLPNFAGNSLLSTWCYRVALNTALTWRRKQSRRTAEFASDQMDGELSENDASESLTQSLLQRFLLTLSEIDQSVLLMYLDRQTTEVIAETIGTSPTAIHTRLSRIRSTLSQWEDENG